MMSLSFYDFGFPTPSNLLVATKATLGGKGYFLKEMDSWGLNVPPGVIIPVDAFLQWRNTSTNVERRYILEETAKAILLKFKTIAQGPLLFSVRSGAPVSMPGMMDTILNVGITPEKYHLLSQAGFSDSYLQALCFRFLTMMASGMGESAFVEELKSQLGVGVNGSLKAIEILRTYFDAHTGILKDEVLQIASCINLVFRSWDSERAKLYRETHNITCDGTACIVQKMVFGNLNTKSCSGVLFSRDLNTGGVGPQGEFLPESQGEEVVNGTTTPLSLQELKDWNPEVFAELIQKTKFLEDKFRDAVDIEFTVEDGQLYFLQVRAAKRTPIASFELARQFYEEGRISREQAKGRLTPQDFFKSKQPVLAEYKPHDFSGLAAGCGLVSGRVCRTMAELEETSGPKILVRESTDENDLPLMLKASGIITKVGGLTCHAALVARSLGIPCVVSVGDKYNLLTPGQEVTLYGSTGEVWLSSLKIMEGGVSQTVMQTLDILGFKPEDPEPEVDQDGIEYMDIAPTVSFSEEFERLCADLSLPHSSAGGVEVVKPKTLQDLLKPQFYPVSLDAEVFAGLSEEQTRLMLKAMKPYPFKVARYLKSEEEQIVEFLT
jgi:pyruvate, orthophosphate dikinase